MPTDRADPDDGAQPQFPGRRERWATDSWDNSFIEFASEADAPWCEKWALECPDGDPQRLCRILGFRERNVGELGLRVVLGGGFPATSGAAGSRCDS